ncbi:MAG: hypothetical protein ACHRHE_21225 [Tepidisphaerales bacterium]
MRHLILLAACCLLAAGCMDDDLTRSTMRQRQDQALKDPFNYRPDLDNDAVDGGGTMDFKKDAFRRDVQHVVNP